MDDSKKLHALENALQETQLTFLEPGYGGELSLAEESSDVIAANLLAHLNHHGYDIVRKVPDETSLG